MKIEANTNIYYNHNQSVQYGFSAQKSRRNLHKNRGSRTTKIEAVVQHLLNPYGRTDPYSLHKNRGPYSVVRIVLIRTTKFLSKLGSDFEVVDWHGFQESFVLGKER
jgi:hypothetical protein